MKRSQVFLAAGITTGLCTFCNAVAVLLCILGTREQSGPISAGCWIRYVEAVTMVTMPFAIGLLILTVISMLFCLLVMKQLAMIAGWRTALFAQGDGGRKLQCALLYFLILSYAIYVLFLQTHAVPGQSEIRPPGGLVVSICSTLNSFLIFVCLAGVRGCTKFQSYLRGDRTDAPFYMYQVHEDIVGDDSDRSIIFNQRAHTEEQLLSMTWFFRALGIGVTISSLLFCALNFIEVGCRHLWDGLNPWISDASVWIFTIYHFSALLAGVRASWVSFRQD